MSFMKTVGAVGFSLALVAPATAAGSVEYGTQRVYRPGAVLMHRMPAQDFTRLGFGIARPLYHSGWGGPYRDGDYPGTVDQNMGPPYWAY